MLRCRSGTPTIGAQRREIPGLRRIISCCGAHGKAGRRDPPCGCAAPHAVRGQPGARRWAIPASCRSAMPTPERIAPNLSRQEGLLNIVRHPEIGPPVVLLNPLHRLRHRQIPGTLAASIRGRGLGRRRGIPPRDHATLRSAIETHQRHPAASNAAIDIVSPTVAAAAMLTPIRKGATYLSITVRKISITHTLI